MKKCVFDWESGALIRIKYDRGFLSDITVDSMNQDLLFKYLENTASDEEMQQVLDWLHRDPKNRKELDALDKAFAASVIYGPDPFNRIPDSITGAAMPTEGRKGFFRNIARYGIELAAVVVVTVGLTWGFVQYKLDEWSRRMTTLEVPAGQQFRMKLEDGTDVWLSAGSRLEYPSIFVGGERRVKIEGEAMFDVEHDEKRPFVVETFACDVKVLGTRFDVAANEKEGSFSTALLHGKVEVTNKLTSDERYILRPNDKIHLVGNHLHVGRADWDECLWTQGLISIKGLTFDQLMHKFEKYFGVDIVIERDNLPDIDYNYGKIRISDGIETALHMLQRTTTFNYIRSEDNKTIYIR